MNESVDALPVGLREKPPKTTKSNLEEETSHLFGVIRDRMSR